jgi:hypothetical protein
MYAPSGQHIFLGIDWHQFLTNRRVTYIATDKAVEVYLKQIKTPKCWDLFVTLIDDHQIIRATQTFLKNATKNCKIVLR